MKKAILMFWVIMMVAIHTIDMELTRHYIGNDWTRETFVPMQLCIKHLGIYPAVWVSRLLIYCFIFWALQTGVNSSKSRTAFATCTTLYWAAMVPWLFSLHFLTMPIK